MSKPEFISYVIVCIFGAAVILADIFVWRAA